jgi:P-type Ca2+ transporter type 2C
VVRDGELIGDPTEGALVVLAAKGGIDAVSTRERTRGSPSFRSTPPTS